MGKSKFILVLLFVSTLLTSCIWHNNRKTDTLFECNFSTEHDEVIYHLIVKKINEGEFNNANGVNVIEDVVTESNDKYFSIKFYSIEEGRENSFNFVNLHDAYESKRVPVRYIDDNLNAFVPLSVIRLTGSPAYNIEFNRKIIKFGGD